jgi:hypothetical protein
MSKKIELQTCEMCGRESVCNEHHLIPKKNHRKKKFKKMFTKDEMNKTIEICKSDCHKAIHVTIPDEGVLGIKYNTLEAILLHPEIEKFVAWVKTQTKKSKF